MCRNQWQTPISPISSTPLTRSYPWTKQWTCENKCSNSTSKRKHSSKILSKLASSLAVPTSTGRSWYSTLRGRITRLRDRRARGNNTVRVTKRRRTRLRAATTTSTEPAIAFLILNQWPWSTPRAKWKTGTSMPPTWIRGLSSKTDSKSSKFSSSNSCNRGTKRDL